jgi:protein-S-isoprenylcysteine O-methyltransferase Ste14
MIDSSAAFVIPRDLRLPAELVGDVPRPLPHEIHDGPLAQKRRAAFWGCLVAAAVCLVLSVAPFVDTLALYLLPLGYLRWISLGLFVIALLSYFGGGALKKAARYVQYGNARFGRVVELIKYPSVEMHGQPTAHAFRATVQVLHPDSDQPVFVQVKSGDFSTNKKDRVETRFQVGDFVPVVWLPNKFDETFQIYDFLELTPTASLQRGMDSAKKPLWQILLLVIAVPGFFFVLFWNVYALERFMPLDFDFTGRCIWPAVTGGVLGLVVALIGWLATRKRARQAEQRNLDNLAAGKAIELEHRVGPIRKAFYGLLIVAGSILLGACTFMCWCFTANALLDRSPIKTKNVRITDMIQTTHDFIVRDYRLKYRFAGKEKDDELLTTPEHLMEFDAPIGIAEIQSGWFGWPWVKTVRPMKFADVLPNNG